MENLNSEQKMNVIPCLKMGEYLVLGCHTEGKRKKILFVMTYLTKEEYDLLCHYVEGKINIPIFLKRDDQVLKINIGNVEVFGDIDFDYNSEDMLQLATFDWFKEKAWVVPANYDYITHTCKSPTKHIKVYDSVDVRLILQYAHGILNKPEYIVIFREIHFK